VPVATATPTARRTGVVTFAGVLLVIAGVFNLFDGLVVFFDDTRYASDELLFGPLTAWGVWWLSIGTLLLVTGIMVLRRSIWGIVFGVTVAGANALSQLMFIGANPGWAIAALVVDGLVIAALTSSFDEFTE
jgi:hypothetical protein